MNIQRRAEIAGAGISGLTFAVALANDGWQVHVHERAPELRSTGGGLYLRAEAKWAAQAIGLEEKIASQLFVPDGMEIRVNGEFHAAFPRDEGVNTMLRSDLHAALVATARAAGVEIHLGSVATSALSTGTLVLADGKHLEADLVIAADGVASQIPASLGIAGTTVRYDDGIIRFLCDRSVLEQSWDKTIDFWSFGDHSLRVLYSPCSATHCYLCLMSAVTDERGASIPLDIEHWIDAFPELALLLRQTDRNLRYDRYGRFTRDKWSKGRVAIIGDAAHAMPSSLGRSASVGMMNAVELARELTTTPDIETALLLWENRQRPEIERIQALAETVAMARSLSSGKIPDLGRIEKETLI